MSNRHGDLSHRERLKLMNDELKAFSEYCQQQGFNDEEMQEICSPLSDHLRRIAMKRRLRYVFYIFVVLSMILCVFSFIGFDVVSWHSSAIGRILMIKALPLWDWRTIFYKECLVDKTEIIQENEESLSSSDCAVCESVLNVPRIAETNYETILTRYLMRGAPVIVTDALLDWQSTKTSDVDLTKLMAKNDRLRESVPCVIETNIRTGKGDDELERLLSKVLNVETSNWFLHVQNCDLKAARALRALAPRPYFLSPHVNPSHFNWLIMSNKYSSPRYKQISLDVGLIIVSQIKGSTLIQLTPRPPCENECPGLSLELMQSETLVLANSMWNFEYMPDASSENTALLTEIAWNEA